MLPPTKASSNMVPVDKTEHGDHLVTGSLRRLDRLDRGSRGGHHVVDDHHAARRSQIALDLPPGAVPLGLLAHDERLQRRPLEVAQRRDRADDRIGPQGQAADRVGADLVFTQQLEHLHGGQVGPLGPQRGLLRVEVVFALLARGQGELPEHQRMFLEQCLESISVGGQHRSLPCDGLWYARRGIVI